LTAVSTDFPLLHHFRVLFELFDETVVREDLGSPLFDKGDGFVKVHMVLSDQISNYEASRAGYSRIAATESNIML
jgi:hypothetical protein